MSKVLEALTQLQVKMPIQTILIVLVITMIMGVIIFLTYKYTYTGVLYNSRFNVSLIMITVVTSIVMVVIGSNISVSLGMVGALSIVRFRTAVKDPRDTAFIFWGITTGLACGTQNYYVALIGGIFVCGMLFALKKFVTHDNKSMIVIRGKGLNTGTFNKELKKQTKDALLKGEYASNGNVELIYEVKFDKKKDDGLLATLYNMEGVESVNIVESNTDTLG